MNSAQKLVATVMICCFLFAIMFLVNGCFSQHGSQFARDLGSLALVEGLVCFIVLHIWLNIKR